MVSILLVGVNFCGLRGIWGCCFCRLILWALTCSVCSGIWPGPPCKRLHIAADHRFETNEFPGNDTFAPEISGIVKFSTLFTSLSTMLNVHMCKRNAVRKFFKAGSQCQILNCCIAFGSKHSREKCNGGRRRCGKARHQTQVC